LQAGWCCDLAREPSALMTVPIIIVPIIPIQASGPLGANAMSMVLMRTLLVWSGLVWCWSFWNLWAM